MLKELTTAKLHLTSAFSIQRSAFLYLLLFLVLALVWLWPVPTRLTSRIPHDPGDPVLNTWILWWNTQAVPFTERWWNPPVFYPSAGALALSEHLFGIAVFTAPLQLAGLNAIGAYNIALILSSWLSGFFAFLLARRLTGSATAGVVAGVAFAFAPYRVGQLSHLQVLTAQWMPLALLAMHAYLDDRRARWLVLCACAWLLQALSNGYYLLFFPVVVAAWLAWFVRWKSDPRPGLALAGTFVLSSVLLLPSLLKYREVHQAMGLLRQRDEMLMFSAQPESFFRMPYMLSFWPYIEPKNQEHFLFPGVTAVILVLAAAFAAQRWTVFERGLARRSPLLFYALATLFIWWLALGPAPEQRPLQAFVKPYTWLAMLPGFDGLRAPSRFAMLGCLTLSIAAALAFRRLRPSRPRARAAVTAAVFAGLFVDGWVDRIPLVAPPTRLSLPDAKDVIVMELPLDQEAVGAAAMFRMINHGRPVISGYSGHSPPHYRILSSAFRRDDPTPILYFAEGRPVVIIVNSHYDADRSLENFVRSLPGIQEHGASTGGRVFLLPAQPRARVAALGPQIQPVSMSREPREHVVYDLGRPQLVRALSFPLRWRFEQLHPHVEVEASLDGVTWTRAWYDWTGGLAVAGALENQREVPIRIQLPDVQARYLRIHPAQKWMIQQLSIHGSR